VVVAWFSDIALSAGVSAGQTLAQSGQPPRRKHSFTALGILKSVSQISPQSLQRLTSEEQVQCLITRRHVLESEQNST